MSSWAQLSKERREAVLRAVDAVFEDLVDDLMREATAASDDANAEEVVESVLSDIVASIEEMSDELGFDPYEDDEDEDEDGEGLSEAIHAYYYDTLLPRRLPPELLRRLDRYPRS